MIWDICQVLQLKSSHMGTLTISNTKKDMHKIIFTIRQYIIKIYMFHKILILSL